MGRREARKGRLEEGEKRRKGRSVKMVCWSEDKQKKGGKYEVRRRRHRKERGERKGSLEKGRKGEVQKYV